MQQEDPEFPFSREYPPISVEYEDDHHSVVLRPVKKDDIHGIFLAIQENSYPMLQQFLKWTHYPQTYEELLKKVQKVEEDYLAGTEYYLTLFDNKTSEFLVSIAVYPGSRRNPYGMELSFWTPKVYAGKGFETLATRIILTIGFICLQCDRAQIVCNKADQERKKVAEECNFHFEGESPNYFPRPTDAMIQKGMPSERTACRYSMIPEDFAKTSWLPKIVESTVLHSLSDKTYPLSYIQAYYDGLRKQGLYL